MKKMMKGFMLVLMLLFVGVIDVVETIVEIMYQLVRLFRRGFRYITDGLLKQMDKLYNGKRKVKAKPEDSEFQGLRIYEIID